MREPDLAAMLDDVRRRIARGEDPDTAALEMRSREVGGRDGDRALQQLERLLAVHRAKRTLRAPAPVRPSPAAPRRAEYRAKPTIAANMSVRARKTNDTVTLEWEAAPGVVQWHARLSERPDARSPYVEREELVLDAPRLELRLGDRPQQVHLLGRNANGRLVRRAVVSGLTSSNWSQRWLQKPTAS